MNTDYRRDRYIGQFIAGLAVAAILATMWVICEGVRFVIKLISS